MKPIIGIISRVEYPGETHKLVFEEEYRQTIIKYGGIPLGILPSQNVDYTVLKYSNQDSFEDFVKLCKKQYTRLLNGYNSVMDLFDKPINIDKFIGCFDINKLYLFTCYKLVKHNYNYYDKYNNLDYTISFVDEYRKIINDLRQKEPFYNSVINVVKDNEVVVYTIDDLFRDLSDLEMRTK